jgi:predicted nucleotidyltransferase
MSKDYIQAVKDVLDFILGVEDGDLDLIIWKLEKFLNEGLPLFSEEGQ